MCKWLNKNVKRGVIQKQEVKSPKNTYFLAEVYYVMFSSTSPLLSLASSHVEGSLSSVIHLAVGMLAATLSIADGCRSKYSIS